MECGEAYLWQILIAPSEIFTEIFVCPVIPITTNFLRKLFYFQFVQYFWSIKRTNLLYGLVLASLMDFSSYMGQKRFCIILDHILAWE